MVKNMNIFGTEEENQELEPLAERIRPTKLEEFIGQEDITGSGKLLTQTIQNDNLFSMILWGPPGTGKTTLARIIANQSDSKFHQINAVSSGIKDVRKVIQIGKNRHRRGKSTILFIDEIHRFNKAQQDALLNAVESGDIILIGATTENPSFEVISPLLSRCRVLKLEPLEMQDLDSILTRALEKDPILSQLTINFQKNAKKYLLKSVGGDARKLLNGLAAAVELGQDEEEKVLISKSVIEEALQDRNRLYDKEGDYHYDTISAFIKSIRGSDPDAALYWMCVMLEGGEDPLFIARRLIILASEDIGNANPSALMMAQDGYEAVHSIGMPEAEIILSQVTTYLASSPKSNASYEALQRAKNAVQQKGAHNVPLHLRNPTTDLMEEEGYGKNYKYPHDKPNHFVQEKYFPDNMQVKKFYHPTEIGREKNVKKRLEKYWPERYGEDD